MAALQGLCLHQSQHRLFFFPHSQVFSGSTGWKCSLSGLRVNSCRIGLAICSLPRSAAFFPSSGCSSHEVVVFRVNCPNDCTALRAIWPVLRKEAAWLIAWIIHRPLQPVYNKDLIKPQYMAILIALKSTSKQLTCLTGFNSCPNSVESLNSSDLSQKERRLLLSVVLDWAFQTVEFY